MASAMRKMGVYLGLVEDADDYDDDGQRDDSGESDFARQGAQPHGSRRLDPQRMESGEQEPHRQVRAVRADSAAPVAHLSERRPRPVGVEMSRITTLHPRTYNEARTIGEHFREGIPVIMNLSEMDDNDAKRLVDFAAGLVFAVQGSIERVTSKVFLLSPPNVTVAAEDKQRIAEGGFFNQS
ncbi:MAG: cell division protein SepF [Nocardioidaceae bacterium]|nr:cell division protein SepF [Nocardioidaceae bacterium]